MKYLFVFIFICLLFGCSGKSSNDYLNDIRKEYNSKNYINSIKLIDEMNSKYPGEDITLEALNIKTTILQNSLIKEYDELTSNKLMVENLLAIYKEYPDKKEGANSLFMAAFYCNEKLNDIKKAEEYYKLFISKYPDNQLTVSAKIEIENLGKPSDAILNNIK